MACRISGFISGLANACRGGDTSSDEAGSPVHQQGRAFEQEMRTPLEAALDDIQRRHGGNPERRLNQLAGQPVPAALYRATYERPEEIAQTGIRTAAGVTRPTTPDSNLAAMLRHSASTGGSGGQMQSFTDLLPLAKQHKTDDRTLVKVNTTGHQDDFRSTADILRTDADRLVAAGKVDRNTVHRATGFVLSGNEGEHFHLPGDVPARMVQVLPDALRNDQRADRPARR